MPDDAVECKACMEHHLQEARKMFLAVGKMGLTVKLAKCHRFFAQVKYFRHILSHLVNAQFGEESFMLSGVEVHKSGI